MPQVHQWIGNVFSRGAGPAELNTMGYHELKYWNEWHEIMNEAERKSMDEAKKGRGR